MWEKVCSWKRQVNSELLLWRYLGIFVFFFSIELVDVAQSSISVMSQSDWHKQNNKTSVHPN